jgi:CHAT domain-containing protein
MLEGRLQTSTAPAKGVRRETDEPTGGSGFVRDRQKPFAHPYYWSPFVLIGNWR